MQEQLTYLSKSVDEIKQDLKILVNTVPSMRNDINLANESILIAKDNIKNTNIKLEKLEYYVEQIEETRLKPLEISADRMTFFLKIVMGFLVAIGLPTLGNFINIVISAIK